MENELQYLGEMIIKKKHDIAKVVHEDRMSGVPLTQTEKEDFKKIEPLILKLRAELIALFGQALIDHKDREKAVESVSSWAAENGEYFFNIGAPLNEALKDTSFYREYIWKAIKEEATKENMSAGTVFEVIAIIDPLLDIAVYHFSLTYVEAFQKSLENTRAAILELSVPVVPIQPGVGVLPLIGNIDAERANLLLEETLRQAEKLRLTHLIIDISGVLTVDTMVANELLKVISTLSLIGVEAIITGIRPEVAQTIVALGFNLKELTVKGNLHQALHEINILNTN
ncbi:STAS domain-containing protein [Evansella sp. LMS18]|uniref:STAS domain-containing protein n=1 Tax=Evansella sp. LMS18 TaxID=2924033 RepID=UPI0020D0D585|nr:STAS domain-containing protein [Evansella sp. LMS18]UTR12719.1 STAS domain-containing protein [Evansella sp. LMS18]